jgi:hypothetical protein
MGEIDDDDSIVLIFFADAGGKKGHKRLNKYLFPAGITTCTPRLQHFSMCNACARHGRASVRTTGARLSRGSATYSSTRSFVVQSVYFFDVIYFYRSMGSRMGSDQARAKPAFLCFRAREEEEPEETRVQNASTKLQ